VYWLREVFPLVPLVPFLLIRFADISHNNGLITLSSNSESWVACSGVMVALISWANQDFCLVLHDIGLNLLTSVKILQAAFWTECYGLRINHEYSSVQSSWIRSLIGVTLAMTSTASEEACTLASTSDIDFAFFPALVFSCQRCKPMRVLRTQNVVAQELYSIIPVAGVSPFLPSINLLS